jgi:cbb3-type cytochrome oxidase cytochrome c subunit
MVDFILTRKNALVKLILVRLRRILMKNKKLIIFIFAAFSSLIFLSYTSAQEAEPAGKKIFMDQKCNLCHSIESQTITKKTATSKAPDLSNVGSEQSAEWIEKFLTKQVMLHEKKHAKAWTGTKEDLTTLATWLATLKKAK